MKKINNKGITLIALVITIIVTLILAAVSVRLILRRKWDSRKSSSRKTGLWCIKSTRKNKIRNNGIKHRKRRYTDNI